VLPAKRTHQRARACPVPKLSSRSLLWLTSALQRALTKPVVPVLATPNGCVYARVSLQTRGRYYPLCHPRPYPAVSKTVRSRQSFHASTGRRMNQSSAMDREHFRKRHHGQQAGPQTQVSSGGNTWVSDLGQMLCRFEKGRRATALPCLLARLHNLAATCWMYVHYSENGHFASTVS
jgi:hypothetical protein